MLTHKINKRQYRLCLILYPYVGVRLKIHELLSKSMCKINSNN